MWKLAGGAKHSQLRRRSGSSRSAATWSGAPGASATCPCARSGAARGCRRSMTPRQRGTCSPSESSGAVCARSPQGQRPTKSPGRPSATSGGSGRPASGLTAWTSSLMPRSTPCLGTRLLRGVCGSSACTRPSGRGARAWIPGARRPNPKKHNFNAGGYVRILAGICGGRLVLWEEIRGTWSWQRAADM